MAIVRVLLAVLSAALAEESCEETAMLQQMKDIHEHKEQDSKFGPSTCTSEDKSCCMSLPKCSSNAMANKMCPGDIGSALTYDCVGSNMFDMTGTGICKCRFGQTCASDGICQAR
mmetsp:Transcript_54665/g.97540  ORF Transcript_54665/g.97540 Transcript_54665/m.97540 type:complete len:115 (+) Transcript_54665:62-406(+)